MSNFPAWWTSAVTIYNKYEGPDGRITWYRHQVTGCFVKKVPNILVASTAVTETDSTICRIPQSDTFAIKSDWNALGDNYRSTHFTLYPGDIIVPTYVVDAVNEYVAGQRSTDLLKKYKLDGAFVIEKISINTSTGVGSPHYYVKGV